MPILKADWIWLTKHSLIQNRVKRILQLRKRYCPKCCGMPKIIIMLTFFRDQLVRRTHKHNLNLLTFITFIQFHFSKTSIKFAVLLSTLMVLTAPATSLIAQELPHTCLEDPKKCTPSELCQVATENRHGSIQWSSENRLKEHIALAKKYDVDCNVTTHDQVCAADASKCSVVQLCDAATISTSSGSVLREDRISHKALIEKFGINCDVLPPSDNAHLNFKSCSIDHPGMCTDVALCEIATYLEGGFPRSKRFWKQSTSSYGAVAEAKRRRLSCDTNTPQPSTPEDQSLKTNNCTIRSPEYCDDSVVCNFATNIVSTYPTIVKRWKDDIDSLKVVGTARARNLNCGVNTLSAAPKKPAQRPANLEVCSINQPSSCDDKALCNLTTYRWGHGAENGGGHKSWVQITSFQRAVTEAKARKLDCGVVKREEMLGTGLPEYSTYSKLSGEGAGEISIGQIDHKGSWNGERFYSWPSGHALFVHGWESGQTYNATSNTDTIFPLLKREFERLGVNDRKRLQSNLKAKGLYDYDVDSRWGRNTLLGLVEYSSERFRTVNFHSVRVVKVVLQDLLNDTSDKAQLASRQVIQKVHPYFEQFAGRTYVINIRELKINFLSLPMVERKQIQYALKALGYYDSAIDGQWGPNTELALYSFNQHIDLYAPSFAELRKRLVSMVDVPHSFSANTPQPAQAKRNNRDEQQPQRPSKKHKSLRGYVAIVANPLAELEQALAICEPQSRLAGRQAGAAFRPPDFGSTFNCNSFGYNTRCVENQNTGGFWGGVAAGLGEALAQRDAQSSSMASCMAHYGWKKASNR